MATAAEITALYDEMLGRAPGDTGLTYWINTGDSIDKIRSDIALSPEYANYQQSLQPTTTTPGTTGGTTGGTTTPTVSGPTAAQITSIYTTMLGRAPDANGLEYWLSTGDPLTSIAGNIALSDEYQQRLNELSTISAADQLKKFNMLKQAQQYSDLLKGQNQDTTSGQSFLPDMPDTMALPQFYGAQSPVELFQNAMAKTMPTAATDFNMPALSSVPDWTRASANVPTNNLFTNKAMQEDPYGTAAKKPSMFAEGGFVNQSLPQNMFQYPAYGGMTQDVFDFSAPVVMQNQLMQTGPGGTLTPMPDMSNPVPMPDTSGGITTLPVVDPLEEQRKRQLEIDAYLNQAKTNVQEDPIPGYRNEITGMYDTILSRKPDDQGLDYWTTMAQQGMSMEDIRRNIQLNEDQKIAQIYKDVLGRDTPDAEGLAYWASSGQDLDTIRRNIEASPEAQARKGISSLPPAGAGNQFVTTNYESGEGYFLNPDYNNSWYAGDSGGAVGANAGAEAAAAAADAAAAAANNDGPGDGVGSAGNDSGAAGQGAGTGAEGPGTE